MFAVEPNLMIICKGMITDPKDVSGSGCRRNNLKVAEGAEDDDGGQGLASNCGTLVNREESDPVKDRSLNPRLDNLYGS